MSADTYAQRATQHRPTTLEDLRATARRMQAEEGYSDHGIAAALGMAVEQVRLLIGCLECGE
jgi:hypothetical protein